MTLVNDTSPPSEEDSSEDGEVGRQIENEGTPLLRNDWAPGADKMIVENGIVDDPEEVGFYSGFIESIFQIMCFITILPCSFISDHLGRKPVVLVGTTGMACSIVLFGMSKSYGTMIATRCIGGTLGGTWSALKVMMAEIYTDNAHRAFTFSTLQIAFRTGQIAGQALGGLLTHPERSLSLFGKPFWKTYPFSLPCFIAGSIAMTSVVLASFTLHETLHSRQSGLSRDELILPVEGREDTPDLGTNTKHRMAVLSVLTPHVLSVLASIFAMTLASETIFALYPLFAFTPIKSGGLGLSEAQIGAHMATRSFLNVFLLFAYTPIQQKFGSVHLYQLGMAMWPVLVMFLPMLNFLARSGFAGVGSWIFDAVLLVFFSVWSIGNLVWPSSQIIVIEAPPSPEALATVNGLAQMIQSLTMGIAPAFVTSFFAFSIERQYILGGGLIYVILLSISCAGAAQSLALKPIVHVRNCHRADEN